MAIFMKRKQPDEQREHEAITHTWWRSTQYD